jgi:hypothetical protein
MTRWSLKNIFQTVSHEQFQNYTTQLRDAAEKAFGTKCALDIHLMANTKVYTTYCDDSLQDNLNQINDANTILRTDDLAMVTPRMWGAAGYVEVSVNPVDPEKAPSFAFAHVEFKGNEPRQACFYIQPDGQDVKDALIKQNRGRNVGDGYTSNGSRSNALPSNLHW